ncbi:hypothetical protein TNCV_766821 [Trichonephila clavipes]|nr:hypothetical protein TNCV_766821 [Trichonephila clavipes]
MATGSYLNPIYYRSQSEVQGDLHKMNSISITRKRFKTLENQPFYEGKLGKNHHPYLGKLFPTGKVPNKCSRTSKETGESILRENKRITRL